VGRRRAQRGRLRWRRPPGDRHGGLVELRRLRPGLCRGPLPADCALPGIRWLRPTRDGSSGCTGSTTFDFEGDGRTEVIYNDECFLRVYDGATGAVLLALANTTGTLIEAPIVADADGDYNTEIIVGSDQGFPCNDADPDTGTRPQQTFGVTVMRDTKDRWVHSRPIWNQNAYAITNVENDGTIPALPEANWRSFNSFRENAQPRDKALEAPDLTVRADRLETRACGPVDFTVSVHNRGSQPVSRGLPVLFLDADPAAGGIEFCRTETTQRLEPTEGEDVTCTWGGAPDAGGLVYVYVDAEVEGAFCGEPQRRVRRGQQLHGDPRARLRVIRPCPGSPQPRRPSRPERPLPVARPACRAETSAPPAAPAPPRARGG
jgi:hypothetical protein